MIGLALCDCIIRSILRTNFPDCGFWLQFGGRDLPRRVARTTAAARDACVEDTGRRLDIPVGAATDLRGSRAPRQAADAPELVTLGG